MANKVYLTNNDCSIRAEEVFNTLLKIFPVNGTHKFIRLFGIPRGGIPAAYLVRGFHTPGIVVVDDPEEADVFIDDIIDSGDTLKKWCDKYPGKPFFALVDKREEPWMSHEWIVFPWEATAEKDDSFADNIVRLLQFIGENPHRGGLRETPRRVEKAWQEWTSGYHQKPENILKAFEDGSEAYSEMVIVKDIPFYSHCEHHLAPFFGTASVCYIPDGKIVGLSKISRLVDIFARRLQVQERLTSQIADALNENLSPIGVGVVIRARHLCMESRGICQQGHQTMTSALRGVLKDSPVRAEFMSLIGI